MGNSYGKTVQKCCACVSLEEKRKHLPGPPGIPPAESPTETLLHGILEITLNEVVASGFLKLFRVSSRSLQMMCFCLKSVPLSRPCPSGTESATNRGWVQTMNLAEG